MAALPKRRNSVRRKNIRRAHDALKPTTLTICPKCKKPKRQHFVCEYCGFYGKVDTKSVKPSSTPVKSVEGKKKTETKKETKS